MGRQWIVGANVLDVESGRFERRDLAIDDTTIIDTRAAPKREVSDTVIELADAWVIPGLIDCHVHLTMPTDVADPLAFTDRTDAEATLCTVRSAERTVLSGITTVRDVGGWNYVEMAVRAGIERGDLIGPRMFLAGRLLSITTDTVRYYQGMYEVCDGPDAVRAAARRQLAAGADLIKVMATGAMLSSEREDARAIQFQLDELRAAVEVAHDNFKHVAAHAHALQGIVNAVEAGVDSIEHCTFADDDALRLMAERGVFAVPTICAGELLFRDEQIVSELPTHLRLRMEEFNDLHIAAITRAHELGVPIAMGTDAGTPGNHHGMNAHECVLMVERCAMTPIDSIRSATLNAAKLLRQERRLGHLNAGAHADVIGFRQNPLDEISTLTDIGFVMAAGRAVRNEL
jgi:imidazolonepropionase-like amidohydrolase